MFAFINLLLGEYPGVLWGWMYGEMDNAWILERVEEWVNDYYVEVWIIEWASEFLSEGMSGRVSQWVSDEMREQSSEEADVWNYESEWENAEVCELMSEDLNQYVSE